MELYLLLAAIALLLLIVLLCAVIIIKLPKKDDKNEFDRMSRNITTNVNETLRTLDEAQTRSMRNSLADVSEKLESVNKTTEARLSSLQESNEKKLSEIQGVVDEKLQKTLEDKVSKAFLTISEQLKTVNRSMGEMQALATNVGDLKKVLTNVKTRGNLGEVQLEKILEQTLAGQYEKNVKTKRGSDAIVEFAVKIPSKDEDNSTIWLPIDAKFPLDRYNELYDAYESENEQQKKSASAAFETAIKKNAKDICEKYIDVPYTTNFGIMFLPTESLFAEVVRREALMEELTQKYKVSVAGPTTVIAFLNSLQMGFRTLAIQKYSAQIGTVLGQTKAEFETFADALDKVKKRYSGADEALDKLIGTRTNKIMNKLKSIEAIHEEPASQLSHEMNEINDDIS